MPVERPFGRYPDSARVEVRVAGRTQVRELTSGTPAGGRTAAPSAAGPLSPCR
jgi:hypothetical protein